MEGVEGMMGRLKLSSEEKKTLKIGGGGGDLSRKEREGEFRPRAVAKLLSEKNLNPEVVGQTVGWIWCPARGISCKALGDNVFLITFNQVSGLRRAVDDGPWSISKEALVVEDFDGSKAVDEYVFASIPIWIRVEKLPLGLMGREAAEMIGNEVGVFLEVAADGDDSAVGSALRVKIRMDIRKPLRRGIMVDAGTDRGERWCPITYEHLPDFCFKCCLIGHVVKTCIVRMEKGVPLPYGRDLRYVPPRRPFAAKVIEPGRSSGSGSWRLGKGSFGNDGGRSRSDGPSWRSGGGSGEEGSLEKKEGEVEVTSPLKEKGAVEVSGDKAKKKLMYLESGSGGVLPDGKSCARGDVNSTMQSVEGDATRKKGAKKGGTFKRTPRGSQKVGAAESSAVSVLQKRRSEEDGAMEVDLQGGSKKLRRVGVDALNNELEAGLSEQPCKSQ